MNLSRRSLLAGFAAGSALALAPPAFAKTPGTWRLGYTTPPAKGLGPSTMRLVKGKMPAGFAGSFYRNGPAQMQYGQTYASHWFDGDGMVHRIAFENGKTMHTGRYVETPKRKLEQDAQKFLAPGFGTLGDPNFPVETADAVNAANTSVIVVNGELYALWEGGSAWSLDAKTLASKGPKTWRADLKNMPFLAHPKREPDGRVWNLAMNGKHVGIYRIAKDGTCEDFGIVDIGVAAYIHDWTMTERKLVILVQPWIKTKQTPPFIGGFDWRPQDGLKVLIIDKDDLKKQRWAQADARAFYHTGAAWEESDGTIRLDAAFYRAPILGESGGASLIRGELEAEGSPATALTQLIIPPSGDGKMIETRLAGDFTQVDPRRHGLRRRLTAMVTGEAPQRPGFTALSVHDWETGEADEYEFGGDYMVEEHLFVPKPGGTKETDAWLIGTAINIAESSSEVHLFDAGDVGGGPVAVWRADYSWPLGFHGTWAGA